MKDDLDNVQSPCVRNCCLDQNDICLGCHRSIEEIIAWGGASNEVRNTILKSAKQRAKQLGNNLSN
jgi:uncharacterized protein